MRPFISMLICFLFWMAPVLGQDVSSLIDQVDLTRLESQVRQFSGEDPTTVDGNSVVILNRENNTAGNDLAADFLKERLADLGLEVEDQQYSANGRNIIATQLGDVYPDSIYIVCAHYDSKANYCADDNASGTIAVLEIARLLSGLCLENTLVYALWDEEEIGLRGSRAYAEAASDSNDQIVGVLNMDMIAWDDDNDMQFDIDVRPLYGSYAITNLLADLVISYSLNLSTNIIGPNGTTQSDHSSFWSKGYPAVLLGEAWSTGDYNDFYHTSGDRISEFNMPYFHEMVKLSLAWAATVSNPVLFNTTISSSGLDLTAQAEGVAYQWVNCNDGYSEIDEATTQTYTVTEDGSYAVVLSDGSCSQRSPCRDVLLTGVHETATIDRINIYPNPTSGLLKVFLKTEKPLPPSTVLSIFSASGSRVLQLPMSSPSLDLDLKFLPVGIYQLQIEGPGMRTVQSFAKGR